MRRSTLAPARSTAARAAGIVTTASAGLPRSNAVRRSSLVHANAAASSSGARAATVMSSRSRSAAWAELERSASMRAIACSARAVAGA